MNYNKPTIPKGTCSNFNFSYLFCIDIQSITKTYAPFYTWFLCPIKCSNNGIYRYI